MRPARVAADSAPGRRPGEPTRRRRRPRRAGLGGLRGRRRAAQRRRRQRRHRVARRRRPRCAPPIPRTIRTRRARAPAAGSSSIASGFILTNYHVDRAAPTASPSRSATAAASAPRSSASIRRIDVALLQMPRAEPAAGGAARQLRHAARRRVGVRDRQSARRLRRTRSRSASSASSAASCSTRASTPTSRPTPPSASATAAGRSSTRAARSSASRRPSARRRRTSALRSRSARSWPCCRSCASTARVARGYIGVGLTDLTPALRRALRLEPERGALVQDVTPDTPAERAGLRAVRRRSSRVDGSRHPLRRGADSVHLRPRSRARSPSLEVWRDGDRATRVRQADRAAARRDGARAGRPRLPTSARWRHAIRARSA